MGLPEDRAGIHKVEDINREDISREDTLKVGTTSNSSQCMHSNSHRSKVEEDADVMVDVWQLYVFAVHWTNVWIVLRSRSNAGTCIFSLIAAVSKFIK